MIRDREVHFIHLHIESDNTRESTSCMLQLSQVMCKTILLCLILCYKQMRL